MVINMKHKYGEFSVEQIKYTKQSIRKSIFFLLLYVDPKTKQEYADVNVNKAFDGLLHRLGGMNNILFCPPELVTVISLLQEAWTEFNKKDFDFGVYRKLILDAGAEVDKIKEV